MKSPLLVIEREGALLAGPANLETASLRNFRLAEHVIPCLLEFKRQGWRIVLIGQQPPSKATSDDAEPRREVQLAIQNLLRSQGIELAGVHICGHPAASDCNCRMPRLGLLKPYIQEGLDPKSTAFVVSSSEAQLMTQQLGLRTFVLDSASKKSDWLKITQELLTASRKASYRRKTNETNISVAVNLDGLGECSVQTGIGFFDHMLEQVSKHAGIDLIVEAAGDLEIDDHHTVEDIGICLGQVLRKALGTKVGINRYGFLLPMDETEAQVSIDLSGRAYFVFNGSFSNEKVGGLATEMVPHFFRSLAEALGATLHMSVQGANSHHMAEACFKAFGRALRQAISQSGSSDLPSTKGAL